MTEQVTEQVTEQDTGHQDRIWKCKTCGQLHLDDQLARRPISGEPYCRWDQGKVEVVVDGNKALQL